MLRLTKLRLPQPRLPHVRQLQNGMTRDRMWIGHGLLGATRNLLRRGTQVDDAAAAVVASAVATLRATRILSSLGIMRTVGIM